METDPPPGDDNQGGSEICNECGRPVHISSGNFVNRVIDFNGYKTRKEMGKPFPIGDFMCADCEQALSEQSATILPFPGWEAKREEMQ